MDQIFVQTYAVTKNTPVISLTQDNVVRKDGKMSKGEKVRGIMRNVKVKEKNKTNNIELLNIGKNKYLDPQAVILEVISGVEGSASSPSSSIKAKPPIVIGALPFLGAGAGLFFAHYSKPSGAKANSAWSYLGMGLLGGFLAFIPYAIWRNNLKTNLGKIASDQKDKTLADKAFENLQTLSKKVGKQISLNREEFGNQFASLSETEKEAFIFIQEGTLALDSNSKFFRNQHEKLNQSAKEKFSESTMESLTTKMGNFNS
jgi:hypothetical protein